MSDRSIYWSVTINNPRSDDEENIATARSRGWIVEGQKEEGQNGTPHYQLSVNTRTQQRFTALKKVFPRAHIEAARNPRALKQYVHKEETRVSELPNSDKYVTSQKRLWELVVDVLESGEPPKEHRIEVGTDTPYWSHKFDALKAFDYACDLLIRQGYHCVETMAVNPQTRSAFAKFWSAIVARRQQDRQTDRQTELISQSVDIPTIDASQTDDSQGPDSEGEGSVYDDGSCSEDETDPEGDGSECSEEDDGTEFGE